MSQMPEPFYVTTPIYYVNARPHLGHAYSTVVADVLSRFHRMCGRETFFLTGTDEHGDKVVKAAMERGLSPLAYANEISDLFRNLWPELDVECDHFIRTTYAYHKKVVEQVLQQIYDAGDIYFSEYEGAYCFGCERFYTEKELIEGMCPDHKTVPEVIREANYFFRMSKYQEWLIDHIKSHPDFIRPERYRNEVLAFLREPLEDLCISRPKTRLQWGITLPFDEKYVTYVWFDALLNYVSALGYPDGEAFERYWPAVHHLIAKDILKPHGIYWPIILKAAGIPQYQNLSVHGYWNIEETKMSKSLGNVVDPLEMKKLYGSDGFRYFIMRDMVFGLDSNFSEQAFVQRFNSDLANDLGNLFSRSVTMVYRYLKGIIPQPEAGGGSDLDVGLKENALKTVECYKREMEKFAFHKAIIATWELINHLNKYIDLTAPWELAKKKSQRKELEGVLYNVLEGLRIVAGLIYPVMPRTAGVMHEHLGITWASPYQEVDDLMVWGKIRPGTRIPKAMTLFPRIDPDARAQAEKEAAGTDRLPQSSKELISINTLQRVDLRIATVLEAEQVPKARKLLKLRVDAGTELVIVAGIAESYEPKDLVGKQVVVVANLKPTKLMGVVSEGMLLAVTDKNGCKLVTADGHAEPGTPLS